MSNEKQETIKDIVAEMRKDIAEGTVGIWSDFGGEIARSYADRIETAHQREVAELERKVAELRECLKETMVDAVAEYKNNSCFRNVKCGEIERCDTCKVMRWRNALKGAKDEGK